MTPGEVCPLHGARRCPRWCGWHPDPPHARDDRVDSDPLVIAGCGFALVALIVLGVIVLVLH